MDKSLGGMIFISYVTCLLVSTLSLYTASTVFFNQNGEKEIYLISAGCFSLALLSLMRLFYLTSFGQDLGSTMKACIHTLDRMKIKTKDVCSDDMQLLKQDLRYYSESPINPKSTFSLSNGTLIGTFATVITYLIILIQFKGEENKNDSSASKTVSELVYLNGLDVTK